MKNTFYRSVVMVGCVISSMAMTGCGLGDTPESSDMDTIVYGSVQDILDTHKDLNIYRSVLRKSDLNVEVLRELNRISKKRSVTLFVPSDRAFALYGQERMQAFISGSTPEELQDWVSDFTIADKVTYKEITQTPEEYRLGASIIDAQVMGDDLAVINGMEIGIDDMIQAEDGIVYIVEDFFVSEEMESQSSENSADSSEMNDQFDDIPPLYDIYSDEMLQSFRGMDKLLIFFHSDSCITCVEWDEMMTKRYEDLPGGSIVLKADFDTEYGLRRDMKITTQSMAVFLDDNGNNAGTVFDPEFETVASFFACTGNVAVTKEGAFC